MLTKLGQRGPAVHEEPGEYRTGRINPDTETDPDADEKRAKAEANQRLQRTEYRR